MSLLSRDDLLRKVPPKVKRVDLDNGDHVFVREMSGHERDAFEIMQLRPIRDNEGILRRYEKDLQDFRAKLAVNVLCDEEGTLLLGPEDYLTLSLNIPASVLDRIAMAAKDLNAISPEDEEALVKNSKSGPSAASPSDSVET